MVFEKHPPKRTLFDGRKRNIRGIPEEENHWEIYILRYQVNL